MGAPLLFLLTILFATGCAVFAVRPTQEITNMEVAIRAAKEVSADQLAPDLYRMAVENGIRARREFRLRNYKIAKELADSARVYAEKAEFESIKSGGKRESVPVDPLAEPTEQTSP